MAGDSPGLRGLGAFATTAWRVAPERCDLVRRPPAPRAWSFEAQPQRVAVDLARTALVVVDMQNDFCHPRGWLASIGVDVSPARTPIPALRELLPWWREQAGPVIWLNWGNRPDRANLPPGVLHVYNPDGRSTGLGDALATAPDPSSRVLTAGHWGAAIVDELVPAAGDLQVAKFRMSGFWDTCLDGLLRNAGVHSVAFAGVNVDQCVLATLIDAACAGYDVLLVEDACATTSPEYCAKATVYNVRQCFGFTTTVWALVSGGPA
jgi:ureidoacrylate peracid hydrolase